MNKTFSFSKEINIDLGEEKLIMFHSLISIICCILAAIGLFSGKNTTVIFVCGFANLILAEIKRSKIEIMECLDGRAIEEQEDNSIE